MQGRRLSIDRKPVVTDYGGDGSARFRCVTLYLEGKNYYYNYMHNYMQIDNEKWCTSTLVESGQELAERAEQTSGGKAKF